MSRCFVFLIIVFVMIVPTSGWALSKNEELLLSYVNKNLEKWQNLRGTFVQRNPNGRSLKGHFAIKRPNRFFMNYAPPVSMKIVSDGVTVMLQQSEDSPILRYPISVTPIPSIFSLTRTRIEEVADVLSVKRREHRIIITMREKKFTGVEINLVFQDKDEFQIIGWISRDFAGETLFLIKDVEYNVSIPGSFFTPLTNKP